MEQERKLYDFKTIPEAAWVGLLATVPGFLTMALGSFGAPDDAILYAPAGVSLVARLGIGFVYGNYDFHDVAEILWAGVQAGVGAAAIIIANTNDINAVTASFGTNTFMSTARAFLAAIIGGGERLVAAEA